MRKLVYLIFIFLLALKVENRRLSSRNLILRLLKDNDVQVKDNSWMRLLKDSKLNYEVLF